MDELLDPTYWLILVFTALLLITAGVGFVAGEELDVFTGLILLGLFGLGTGVLVTGLDAELFGSLVVVSVMGLILTAFFPLQRDLSFSVFLIGFLAGLSIHRHRH